MKATIKIFSKSKQTKGKGLDKHTSIVFRDLFKTEYNPDTTDNVEAAQACSDFALHLMGSRKLIGLSKGVTVPSSLYFSIELDGITFRSDSSETLSQWKGLFSVPTSKLKGTFAKGGDVRDSYIGIMENRLSIAADTIASVEIAQNYADMRLTVRQVNAAGELVAG